MEVKIGPKTSETLQHLVADLEGFAYVVYGDCSYQLLSNRTRDSEMKRGAITSSNQVFMEVVYCRKLILQYIDRLTMHGKLKAEIKAIDRLPVLSLPPLHCAYP